MADYLDQVCLCWKTRNAAVRVKSWSEKCVIAYNSTKKSETFIGIKELVFFHLVRLLPDKIVSQTVKASNEDTF